jgi:hypothetical protein
LVDTTVLALAENMCRAKQFIRDFKCPLKAIMYNIGQWWLVGLSYGRTGARIFIRVINEKA